MKRYIGNTGEVHIIDDNIAARTANSRPETDADDDPIGSIFGNLFGSPRAGGRQINLPFGLEMGDIAILLLLFFLFQESGDEEFLILLACFAFCIISK